MVVLRSFRTKFGKELPVRKRHQAAVWKSPEWQIPVCRKTSRTTGPLGGEWSAGGRIFNTASVWPLELGMPWPTLWRILFINLRSVSLTKFIFTDEATVHLHGKVNRPMYAYGELKTHMSQLSTSRDSPKPNVFCPISSRKLCGIFFLAEH